jgi:starch synthase
MLPVLAVASEVFPLVKTGGLADVVGALPGALRAEDIAVTTLVPGYPAVMAALKRPAVQLTLPDLFDGPARVLKSKVDGLDLLVIDAPHLYDRPGGPYGDAEGRDWADNAIRFAALGAVAATIGRGAIPRYTPALVHLHDWQAGLTAAYLAYGGPAPPSVFTVHNLAYQGQFPASLLETLGLPLGAMAIDGVGHHGAIGYLKAGLQLATHVTTVSPSYADEIRTEAGGMGMDGVLRHRGAAVSGIVNGIDTAVWNPSADPLLPHAYSAARLQGKARNKAALQEKLGLPPDAKAPVFGVISRLVWQKGLDLLLEALPALVASGGQLALLGAGEAALQQGFASAAAQHPGQIACVFGYDEALAHLIQAGADALIMPSRFEPCGLTQLCALRYGTIPVVTPVGGLRDTVRDGATGVVLPEAGAEALAGAIKQVAALHADKRRFNKLIRAAMAEDVSWAKPAAAYAALYRRLAPPA